MWILHGWKSIDIGLPRQIAFTQFITGATYKDCKSSVYKVFRGPLQVSHLQVIFTIMMRNILRSKMVHLRSCLQMIFINLLQNRAQTTVIGVILFVFFVLFVVVPSGWRCFPRYIFYCLLPLLFLVSDICLILTGLYISLFHFSTMISNHWECLPIRFLWWK